MMTRDRRACQSAGILSDFDGLNQRYIEALSWD